MPFGLKAAGVAAAIVLLPGMAGAVTYDIDFGSYETTFSAPEGGGAVSDLVAVLGGVTFDTPDPANPPFYSPATNDFMPEGGGIFSFYLGGAGCPQPSCVLEFEDAIDATMPPVWAAFPLVMGVPGEVFASGSYIVTPSAIPAPAAVWLLGTALAGLGFLRLGRRRALS
jgi:hypothetical protein